ncbi:swr1 complex component, partial [Tulasnella sp. 427]
MSRSVTQEEALKTSGARPGVASQVHDVSPSSVVAHRNAVVEEREKELALILDRYDDLVRKYSSLQVSRQLIVRILYAREAFHVERFVSLVHYDPKAAEEDGSHALRDYFSGQVVPRTTGDCHGGRWSICLHYAATAKDIPSLVLRSEAATSLLSKRTDLDFDVLHYPAVKLQLAFPDPSSIQFNCGKLQKLDVLLRKKAGGGHRLLIFTQMTRVLDILETFLNLRGHRYLRLDGATGVERRQLINERFNIDTRVFALIASSRSGGVGINLTGADTTREVQIYRLVSCHTIEEAILRKENQKLVLDDMVIQKGEFDWNRILVDEMEGKMSGRKLEEALAFVDDPEEVEAARPAAVESTADQADFEWEMDDLAISESPSSDEVNDTLGGGANGELTT